MTIRKQNLQPLLTRLFEAVDVDKKSILFALGYDNDFALWSQENREIFFQVCLVTIASRQDVEILIRSDSKNDYANFKATLEGLTQRMSSTMLNVQIQSKEITVTTPLRSKIVLKLNK